MNKEKKYVCTIASVCACVCKHVFSNRMSSLDFIQLEDLLSA